MGKFKNFFVEEVQNDFDYSSEYQEEIQEEMIDVNTDNISQDNLINDIYEKNSLSDLSKSIFKVEELSNSLPKEMPNETKKVTVTSILNSFGLSVNEVIVDGNNRNEILHATLAKVINESNTVIYDNEKQIEELKFQIQELEKSILEKKNETNDMTLKITAETNRISDLVKFMK